MGGLALGGTGVLAPESGDSPVRAPLNAARLPEPLDASGSGGMSGGPGGGSRSLPPLRRPLVPRESSNSISTSIRRASFISLVDIWAPCSSTMWAFKSMSDPKTTNFLSRHVGCLHG